MRYNRVMANGLSYIRKTTSPETTKQLAATLAPFLRKGDVVLLSGDLGAGKTQFVQGVASALHASDSVTSPTFNLMLSYLDGDLPLYHFDLYRLETAEELEDIGYFETLEGDGVSFVEWGDKFPESTPYESLSITIFVDEAGVRWVHTHAFGERARRLLFLWANDSRSRLQRTTMEFE
ncbi:MAG: tRNA (adenosine(37)-N6)-threonylcarbamoyltransferase complex ATPase subunit type 1 TsaE [Raoultibacter sp.]